MRSLHCVLSGRLPVEGPLSRMVRGHRLGCLHCQAVAARGRSLTRELVLLGDDMVSAPPWLAASVMARLSPQDAADPRRQLVVRAVARYTAAAATAVTAVAVVAGLARWRSRLPA
jgi:pimeloyl-ACP methyl ester carboxylesterase